MNVLLLHAWPVDERMWEPQAKALVDAGHTPSAPRLYGRGAAIDGWASQLLGEEDGTFVAVGASMGGYTALALARRAPERVLGIVLAGSRADADSTERRQARDETIRRLRMEGVWPELETSVDAEELAVAQEAIRDRPNASGVVASFGGPLLVCVGDRDEIVSVEEARAVADDALRGSFEVFPGAGHLLSVDKPARFNDVLLGFLAQWK
ncbi:MAG: alpha/beta fold hydrolase [Actinobacteria bacterium]|nr:alpha/beta fold hydrolase [Actinomycetota bacterium]